MAQPQFAAARAMRDAAAAAQTVGFPAVLKPADSGGQRGVFRLDSIDDLEAHLHVALAESGGGEVVLERFHEGLELNGIVIVRDGEPVVVTLSDRLRPPGIGFGVGWIHVYPTTIYGDELAEAARVALHASKALGLRDGIAFPQLLVTDDGRARDRGRRAHPRRPDGRPRAPRRRRRPRRGGAAAGARRAGLRTSSRCRTSSSRSRSGF